MKSLFYIVILFAFLSCSIKPEKKPPVAPSPNLSNEFKKASLDQKKKRYSQAVKRYKLIIEKAPNSDLADDAHIEIGNIYFQKKMFDAAYESFISVVNAQTYSPREAFAMFMAARCLTEKGRYNEALSLTDRASRHETFSSKDILELKRLRLFLYHQLGDPIDELASISELLEHETNENLKKSYRIQGEAIVSHQLPYDSIKKVASASRYGVFSSVAEFELGKLEYKQGDFSSARSYLKDSLSGLTSSSQILEAQQMLTNIDARRRVDPQTIGVILPLSGKHATVAERTLRGLQLGLGVFGSDRSNYSLAVLDSNSNPDQAAEAVERLVVEDNVIAIVGSLLSKTAQSVSAKSNELGVPNISLSQKEGLTKTGQYVFRNALTSDMLVKQLVATAMEKRGYKKFAILYPNDKYGIEYANLFWDEVLRRGGEITGAQPYTSKETDFSGPIRRLVGTFYIEDRISEYRLYLKDWKKKQKRISERNTPPTDLLPPIVDFDALFIPDGVKALGQIAPTLPYHDISNLPLMGTNLWNNSQLISRGQSLVEKSIFVDGLVTQNTNFKKTQFFNEYKKTFGLEPGMLEAQAYDIGLMLRQLINSGVNSRVELAQALSHIRTFNGSLGQLAVDESGEFTRPIYSLTVLNGKILSEDIAEMERQNATTTQ